MDRNVIDGFESLTPTDIIRMASQHVIKNGRACMVGDDCSYLDIGCAAAVFLKEERRDKVLPVSWHILVEEGEVPSNNMGLITDIQLCHDINARVPNEEFIPAFKGAMRVIAHKYNGSYILVPELAY